MALRKILIYVMILMIKNEDKVLLEHRCKNYGDTCGIYKPTKHSEWKWFDLNNLLENLLRNI